MKWFLIIAFNLFVVSSYGQRTITKYCEINIRERAFSNNVSVEVVPGKVDSLTFFSDKNKMSKISKLVTRTDVLNFMSSEGWKLAFITSINKGDEADEHVVFAKEFELSELINFRKH